MSVRALYVPATDVATFLASLDAIGKGAAPAPRPNPMTPIPPPVDVRRSPPRGAVGRVARELAGVFAIAPEPSYEDRRSHALHAAAELELAWEREATRGRSGDGR